MPIPKLPKPAQAVPLKVVLAYQLKKYRGKMGCSQEELSYLAGIHRTAVGHIEGARRNVTLETLEALAGALQVAPNKLLELPAELQQQEL